MQIHTDILQPYFSKWKLTINADKTEIINFRKEFPNTEIYQNIRINNNEITPKSFDIYLEVILNEKLTYLKHIKAAVNVVDLRYLYPLMINDKLTK